MYNITIIGAGICGLNLARLLKDKGRKKICILEKSNRIGGLIKTKHLKIKDKSKTHKVKIEAGGAVLFDYQKNMKDLVKKFDIDMASMSLDNKGRHNKTFWDGTKRRRPMNQKSTDKYFSLLRKVFKHMDNKGDEYCRKYTLEQICLEVLTFKETRFIEFCYGYAAEFRIANAVVAKKNLENELFNSKKILFYKKGYSDIIHSIYNSIKDDVELHKNTTIKSFQQKKGYIELKTKNGKKINTKKLVLAIPKEALMKMCDSFTDKELELFQSVAPSSLTRVFAKYDMSKKQNKWMKDLQFSTVKNPIRQIIPARKNIGFFQISYSDWYFANYWGSLNLKDTKKVLKKLLQETFQYEKIDNPTFIKKYYWRNAVHFWKPNINEKQIHKKILQLRKNVFIGGESFSLNQGWAEGSIQTSISLSKLL